MIDLGSVYQVAVDVRGASGTLTDPASASLSITLPDGTVVSPTVPLPPDSTGQVRVDYVTVQAGRHVWRLTTASPVTAYADVFDVAPAAAVGIVSLADAKKQLNISAANTTDDDELRGYIAATTRAVERALGRAVVRRTVTERVSPRRGRQVLLRTVPVLSLTSVTAVDGSQTWDVADLDVDAETGLVTVLSGPALCGGLDVVYEAGETAVREDWRLGALIILKHLWDTQRGAMGVVMSGDGEVAPPPGYAIPWRAVELLGAPLPGVA